MDQDHEPDEHCMRRLAEGQQEALAILVRRYAGPLLTFLHRMSGDRHRAEEIFQDVCLALWTHRRRYDYPRPFRAWLFGIAANKCRASCRRWMMDLPPAEDPARDPPVASDPSPCEATIRAETAQIVAAAVARLPLAQRTALVLRVWSGLSCVEIAESLQCEPRSVRSNVSRALAALRKCLEPRLRRGD